VEISLSVFTLIMLRSFILNFAGHADKENKLLDTVPASQKTHRLYIRNSNEITDELVM
jgi:hypothetical protein